MIIFVLILIWILIENKINDDLFKFYFQLVSNEKLIRSDDIQSIPIVIFAKHSFSFFFVAHFSKRNRTAVSIVACSIRI